MDEKLCSFLIPTRWRPEMAINCIRSIVDTAQDKQNFEILVRVHHNDEPTLKAMPRMKAIHPNVRVLVSSLEGTWQMLAKFHDELIAMSHGKWLWFLNDDVQFEDGPWDAPLAQVPTEGFIVYPEYDQLDQSKYKEVVGGPFPAVPNGSWGKELFGEKFGGFNIDLSLDWWFREQCNWKARFITNLTIHHFRIEGMKLRKMN